MRYFLFFIFILFSKYSYSQDIISNTNEEIKFYQKYISNIRGFKCPMYPSCSRFSMETFKQNSLPISFILTADRLLRCGHENKFYDLTIYENDIKYIDLANNAIPEQNLRYNSNDYSELAYNSINNKDSNIIFIESLINDKFYSEALIEIKRYEFYNKFNIFIFINKLLCYKSLGKYENIIYDYNTFLPLSYKNNVEILYLVTFSYYLLGNYKKSIYFDSLALVEKGNSKIQSNLIVLKGLNYLQLNEINKSKESFINHANSNKYNAYFNNFTSVKPKKPLLAGILSIIPGLGYYYANHKQTAISAFLINSLFAFATINSFQNKNYGVGTLLGIFNLSFYIGNVYGSVKSAKKINELKKSKLINLIEKDISE